MALKDFATIYGVVKYGEIEQKVAPLSLEDFINLAGQHEELLNMVATGEFSIDRVLSVAPHLIADLIVAALAFEGDDSNTRENALKLPVVVQAEFFKTI